MTFLNIENLFFPLLLSPLLLGVINRTKAFFSGRNGQPLTQAYYDIFKLLKKGSVYSPTTTFIFRASPLIGLAIAFTVLALIPFGMHPALISFQGDIILIAYLLGLLRFLYVIQALDTGSSFEGMGASRDVQFALFAEVALISGIATLSLRFETLSLSQVLLQISISTWSQMGLVLGMCLAAFLIVMITENARIPIDDPNTHLELTMIHEVMVLDHSGIDLAMIFYTQALKLWIYGTLLVKFIPSHTDSFWVNQSLFILAMLAVAATIGILESIMARLKLLHIPQLLIGALTLSVLAFFLLLKG